MFAGGLCLLFMIPMGIEMYRTKSAAVVFYDSERDAIDASVERRSNEYYLIWLLGMLSISARTVIILKSTVSCPFRASVGRFTLSR